MRCDDASHRDASVGDDRRTFAFSMDGCVAHGQRVQCILRFAGAMRLAGIKREGRVLLLMLASVDWPVAFLSDVVLRLVSSAGEALPCEIGERFKWHFGLDIVDGSTEMLHILISNSPQRVRYGTTGWAVPGCRIELKDEAGGLIADGEFGDLYTRSPSAALMYWGDCAKTRETFQGGRTKAGDNFIGVADADGLTKSKAFVVPRPERQTTESELKDRLAPYKYPRYIAFAPELPKIATGKI